jgi:hypothetical protein
MPERMEKSLRGRAAAKGMKGDRYRRYVYGAMRKKGWRPQREIAAERRRQGEAMGLKQYQLAAVQKLSEFAYKTTDDDLALMKKTKRAVWGHSWYDPSAGYRALAYQRELRLREIARTPENLKRATKGELRSIQKRKEQGDPRFRNVKLSAIQNLTRLV